MRLGLYQFELGGCRGVNGSRPICLILSSFWYISFKGKDNGVVVPSPFGNSSLGNFQFGFWLGSLGAYVFFVGNGELRLMLAIWDGVW